MEDKSRAAAGGGGHIKPRVEVVSEQQIRPDSVSSEGTAAV